MKDLLKEIVREQEEEKKRMLGRASGGGNNRAKGYSRHRGKNDSMNSIRSIEKGEANLNKED